MLQLAELCEKIALFLQSRLSMNSFSRIKKIAEKFDVENLKKACGEFATENFDLMIKHGQFDQLDMEYVSFLISSVGSSHPGVEGSKLAAILLWIKADVLERSQYLAKMLSMLNLKEVSLCYGKHLAETEELFFQSAEIMRLLYLVGMDRLDVMRREPKVCFAQVANSIIVFDLVSEHLMAYEPATETCISMHPLCEDMTAEDGPEYTIVVFRNFIYVLMADKKVYRINFYDKDATWTERESSLEKHRDSLTAAACGEFIYLAGNHSMERYSHVKDEWEEILSAAALPYEYCSLAHYRGWIYAIGGRDKYGKISNEVYRFSHAFSCWSKAKPMQLGRFTPGSTVYQDMLYISGGSCDTGGDLPDAECYSLESDSWQKIASMVEPCDEPGLSAVNGKLFVIGPCSMEVFDSDIRKWSAVPYPTNIEEKAVYARATVVAHVPNQGCKLDAVTRF